LEYVCYFIPCRLSDTMPLCLSSFLLSLKDTCLSKPGNLEFWSDVKKIGRDLSLISKTEAKKLGGLSSITDDEAEEVRSSCEVPKQWLLIFSLSVYFLNNQYVYLMICLSFKKTNALRCFTPPTSQ
jgi:Ku C terminal domain like